MFLIMYKFQINNNIYRCKSFKIKNFNTKFYLYVDKFKIEITDEFLNSLSVTNKLINFNTFIFNKDLYMLKQGKPKLVLNINSKHIKNMILEHFEIKEILICLTSQKLKQL